MRIVVTLLLALSVAGSARADLPPPEGYVESCTSAIQTGTSGDVCVDCNTYFGEPDACVQRYQGEGYTKRCQSWGASTWNEVWCRPRTEADGPAPPAPPPPAPAPAPAATTAAETQGEPASSGCAVGRGENGAWAIALAALAWFASRRARSRAA